MGFINIAITRPHIVPAPAGAADALASQADDVRSVHRHTGVCLLATAVTAGPVMLASFIVVNVSKTIINLPQNQPLPMTDPWCCDTYGNMDPINIPQLC